MAKFYGKVGYADGNVETPPGSGVWIESIVEVSYFGDVVRNGRKIQEDQKVNYDLSVDSSISIMADAYANEHFFAIRYVEWMGALWVVTSVNPESPRLILRLGGVYNGPTPTESP